MLWKKYSSSYASLNVKLNLLLCEFTLFKYKLMKLISAKAACPQRTFQVLRIFFCFSVVFVFLVRVSRARIERAFWVQYFPSSNLHTTGPYIQMFLTNQTNIKRHNQASLRSTIELHHLERSILRSNTPLSYYFKHNSHEIRSCDVTSQNDC